MNSLHTSALASETPVRMDENLRVSIDSLVELLIGNFNVIDTNLMRYNEARLCLACNNEISEVAVVMFDVALPGGKTQALIFVSWD